MLRNSLSSKVWTGWLPCTDVMQVAASSLPASPGVLLTILTIIVLPSNHLVSCYLLRVLRAGWLEPQARDDPVQLRS
jgi:hypothetical protein